nr:hypothetical protein [Tanacetum cinerariifolium]
MARRSKSVTTIRFLCSYGGRILPRHPDGKLRYYGGETRVLAVSRSISFSELLLKVEEVCGIPVALRCQLPTEDLDALISITCDEDVVNLIEEYEPSTSIKIRAFLLLSKSSSPRPRMKQMVKLPEKKMLRRGGNLLRFEWSVVFFCQKRSVGGRGVKEKHGSTTGKSVEVSKHVNVNDQHVAMEGQSPSVDQTNAVKTSGGSYPPLPTQGTSSTPVVNTPDVGLNPPLPTQEAISVGNVPGKPSYATISGKPNGKKVNVRTLFTPGGNGIDVVVSMDSNRAISERFANTAYGFFLGECQVMLELFKLRADMELKDNIVMAMPKITREGHYTCNVHGKLRLLDNDGNPLVPTGIVKSDSEVEVVFDETANLEISTSGKDGSDKVFVIMSLYGYSDDKYDDANDVDNVTLISKLDVSHPLHLHPNDFVALTVVSVKLKGTENYQVWMDARTGEKIFKQSCGKSLGEDISILKTRWIVENMNMTNCNHILNEMNVDLNVFRPLMLNGVGRHVNDTNIVTVNHSISRKRIMQLTKKIANLCRFCDNISNTLVFCFGTGARDCVLSFSRP